MTDGLTIPPTPTFGEGGLVELATKGQPVGERIAGVQAAITAARGRIGDAVLDDVAAAVDKSAGRLRLSARHTVVAIAGATGSGKSSTYNALTGLELSSVGVRRPTTSWATAVVWGSQGAEGLLDWLGIPPRHQTMRDSMLDTQRDDASLDGVVLLDLPDHDSTEVSHHLEVDRLVAVADLLVWILDPQKYADAAIHDRYFKRLGTHQGVMLVALNHIDTVPENQRQAMLDDVRRLLAADGLPNVPVLGISAKHGIGMSELRREILTRVEGKRAATLRVEADIAAAAQRLEVASSGRPATELTPSRVEELEDRVADAAGITSIVDGIERSLGAEARRAVAWPPLSFGVGNDGHLPAVAPLDRSSVDTTVRGFVDEVTDGTGSGWARRARSAATGDLPGFADRLDERLQGVDVRTRLPAWVTAVRLLHWLLLLAACAGLGWLIYALVSGGLGDTADVVGVPLPVVIGVGGLLGGLVLDLVGRAAVGGLARGRADDADEALRGVVHDVVGDDVVAPVRAELASYADFTRGLAAARG